MFNQFNRDGTLSAQSPDTCLSVGCSDFIAELKSSVKELGARCLDEDEKKLLAIRQRLAGYENRVMQLGEAGVTLSEDSEVLFEEEKAMNITSQLENSRIKFSTSMAKLKRDLTSIKDQTLYLQNLIAFSRRGVGRL